MNDAPMEGELVEAGLDSPTSGALAQIMKAEIDQQIATAHQWPRSIAKFQKRALEMVTLDEETAESCIYSRPVGKEKNEKGEWVTKYAEGMSIRMAEIVGACYGNLRVGSMLVELNPRFVKARGAAHDLESNFASQSEVIESCVDKYGKPYSERQRVVVAKAALSKARRDATFTVVPKALCRALETAARQTAIGDATTLEKRRSKIMSWITYLGIDATRVFAALGVAGLSDLGLDHLTTLTGLKTAIKDGETSVDEAFPPIEPKADDKGAAATTAAAAAAKAADKAKSKGAAKGEQKAPPADAPVDKSTGEVLPAQGDKAAAASAAPEKVEQQGELGGLDPKAPAPGEKF